MLRVEWAELAVNEMTAIWLRSSAELRRAITQASYHIDQTLANEGDTAGESRESGRRIFFAFPLGLTFEVHQELKLIIVLHVWQIRGPKSSR